MITHVTVFSCILSFIVEYSFIIPIDHNPEGGHLRYFWFGDIANKAATSIYVKVFMEVSLHRHDCLNHWPLVMVNL